MLDHTYVCPRADLQSFPSAGGVKHVNPLPEAERGEQACGRLPGNLGQYVEAEHHTHLSQEGVCVEAGCLTIGKRCT